MSDIAKVSAALVRAQRAFGPALKDKTNPAFRSKYADLGACIDAVMDALNANGLALIQRQHPHDGGVCVETIFLHESGEHFSAGMLAVPAAKQDPQGYGSALTYCRRYSLMAACGIAPEDDDGNAASKPRAVGMAPNILRDWLQCIGDAGADEWEALTRDGLAAAKEVKDAEAYAAIRAAGTKRREAA